MVREQEVWLRYHYVQGRYQRGRKVQEQRPNHLPEEEASISHALCQIPGTDRCRCERSPKSLQNCLAES